MTNLEYIRSISAENLAEYLIREQTVNEGEEDIYGDRIDFFVDVYLCPDGTKSYDYETAVEHTTAWLNSQQEKDS